MATTIYKNHSKWIGGHKGHIKMENGIKLDFSAPPELHGYPNVLTPEDAETATATSRSSATSVTTTRPWTPTAGPATGCRRRAPGSSALRCRPAAGDGRARS